MSKYLILLGMLLMSLTTEAQKRDFVQASYKLGSAKEFLQRDTDYPRLASNKNITGDVVYRIKIDASGKTDTLMRINPGPPILAARVAGAFEKLTGTWNPTLINGEPSAYQYLIVFRFRLDIGEGFPHFERRCQRFIEREKWKKALEVSDEWMRDDAFNANMWATRAQILEAMNLPGSAQAKSKAEHLAREVLHNIPIMAQGNELINTNGAVERFD